MRNSKQRFMKAPILRDFIKEELAKGAKSDNELMDILELRYMQGWEFHCKCKKGESLRKFLHKMLKEGCLEVVRTEPQGKSTEIFYRIKDMSPDVVEPVGSIRAFINYLFKR